LIISNGDGNGDGRLRWRHHSASIDPSAGVTPFTKSTPQFAPLPDADAGSAG
jgi:hypothetical protein